MLEYLKFFLLLNSINLICSKQEMDVDDELNTKVIALKSFMFWPNGTIPFYIESDHFDNEQALSIMKALAMFAFKTCLKFLPVLETPKDNVKVMTFVNPNGYRRCKIDTTGHSVYENFKVTLGYDCLKSPQIDMMIMKALGFNFEHNRLSRELYINVMTENVEPGAVELFTKDVVGLPPELRALPYDINSVMHFGERDYSKNGHKTISFKNRNNKQHREGLTEIDLKKIEIVYGNECRQRDRQEKMELCQSYPGVVRRKRDTETAETVKSLRVNPNITPPPPVAAVPRALKVNASENKISETLKELGVDEEAQTLVDNIFKLSASALLRAREKYCKNPQNTTSLPSKTKDEVHNPDIIGILELVGDYTIETVEKAVSNLSIFCETADVLGAYQRSCDWRIDTRCRPTYRSTKTGLVHYSTKHQPYIVQPTRVAIGLKYSYDKMAWRSGNETEETTTPQVQVRRKREATEPKITSTVKEELQKEKMNVKERSNLTQSASNITKDSLNMNENKRRFFEPRRYQNKKSTNKSEWAASDVSSEKGSGVARDKEIADVEEINNPAHSPQSIKGTKINQETSNFGEWVGLGSREVSIVEENVAKEVEKDESDTEALVPQENKDYAKTKSKNKMKIKDTFELMDKKSEKMKSPKQKKRAHNGLPETVKLTKLNKEFYNERRWPEGVLRYVISPQEGYDLDDMRARLRAVADILKRKTCVRLQEVTEDEAINYEDYLVLDTSPDYVTGRVGGQQHFGSIELFKGGQHKQHTAMMVMAMLGFYFEVARHDRDKYIRVHMRHVRPDKLHHFEKIRDEATLDLPYDFKSATHPAWQFWRKIGRTGISTVATFKDRDPDGSVMKMLGQHDQLLSDYDIIKINSIYGLECFTENENRRAADYKNMK